MQRHDASYFRERARRAGAPAIKEDAVIAVLSAIIGWLFLNGESASSNAFGALGIGLGAAVLYQSGRWTWRFVWTAPRDMHFEGLAMVARLEKERDDAAEKLTPHDWMRQITVGYKLQRTTADVTHCYAVVTHRGPILPALKVQVVGVQGAVEYEAITLPWSLRWTQSQTELRQVARGPTGECFHLCTMHPAIDGYWSVEFNTMSGVKIVRVGEGIRCAVRLRLTRPETGHDVERECYFDEKGQFYFSRRGD